VELLGEHCLLRRMTKAVLERALAEELTEHLGYEVGDPAGAVGQQPQRLHAEDGAHPSPAASVWTSRRDRNGTIEPRIIREGQRRLDGIDKIVIYLYARGMSVGNIRAHLEPRSRRSGSARI
jgi:putative transposase